MAKVKVKCGKCKHEFWKNERDNESCPKCGAVVMGSK